MDQNQAPVDNVNVSADEQAPVEAPSTTEIDGLSEFTFQGQKYTPEQLLEIVNKYKEMSESQESVAGEDKYYRNLKADLDLVKKDPRLAQQFKSMYPASFHHYLDFVTEGQAPAQPGNAQPALPKEFLDKIQSLEERVAFHEDRAYQAEVSSQRAKLDSMLEPLEKKYPMTDIDKVLMRAERMYEQAHRSKQKVTITPAMWERFVREEHEYQTKRADQFHGAKLKEQIEKGRQGQDTGPGGASPGQAPQRIRTFKEAEEAMLKAHSR